MTWQQVEAWVHPEGIWTCHSCGRTFPEYVNGCVEDHGHPRKVVLAIPEGPRPDPLWDPACQCACHIGIMARTSAAEDCNCIGGRRTAPIVTRTVEPHKYTEKSARARLERQRTKGVELGMVEIDGDWHTTQDEVVGRVPWTLAPVIEATGWDAKNECYWVRLEGVLGRRHVSSPVSKGDLVAIPGEPVTP